MIEVEVTTGTIDVQSFSQIITTNKLTPSFCTPDTLAVTQPRVSEH